MQRKPGLLMRLFNKRERRLRGACARTYRLGYDDTEEILQITRITLTQLDASRFVPDHPKNFIFAVVRNHVRAMYRSRAAAHISPLSIDSVAAAHARNPKDVESLRSVFLAAAVLTTLLRDAWLARDVLGLSAEEAARLLGTEPPLIDKRVFRARRKLLGICSIPPPPPMHDALDMSSVIETVFERARTMQETARGLGILIGNPVAYFGTLFSKA